jgi:hypothetical protein
LRLTSLAQVTGFLAGERNYAEIHGDTGPLVYPAGFLYIYSGIKYVTGGAVLPAQVGQLVSILCAKWMKPLRSS